MMPVDYMDLVGNSFRGSDVLELVKTGRHHGQNSALYTVTCGGCQKPLQRWRTAIQNAKSEVRQILCDDCRKRVARGHVRDLIGSAKKG